MNTTDVLIGGVAGLLLGGGGLALYSMMVGRGAKAQAEQILENARRDAELKQRDAHSKAKEIELTRTAEVERKLNKLQEEMHQRERKLDRRQSKLDQKADDLVKQESYIESAQNRLKIKLEQAGQHERDLHEIFEKQRKKLHELTGLNKEEATKRLLKLLEDELTNEVGSRIIKHEKKMQEICDDKAREILLMTTQRFAAAHTADATTSTVDIPNDDMKGRIIGREGRNIRSFEKETGVDVIIDDTPGVVIVSGFDPVRREIARQSLEKLIADGRIHPTRIEEIVKETQAEIEAFIRRKGGEAVEEVDVQGLHKKIIEYLGRLHFRTSYSQNVLRHSIEVSFLSGMLAEMMGLDSELAKRCGLLHDIGKAADHEMEGGHPKIGADLLRRHGEEEDVVHAALGHHDSIVVEHPYTVIVATADACSASRPGARRESLDRYIKRMEELESIAKEFAGVQRAFAIQAGREVRVIASAKDTDDNKAAKICRDIASAFQERLTYPGEIKVTVIRESRFLEIAK